jgi:hypothetical protein
VGISGRGTEEQHRDIVLDKLGNWWNSMKDSLYCIQLHCTYVGVIRKTQMLLLVITVIRKLSLQLFSAQLDWHRGIGVDSG